MDLLVVLKRVWPFVIRYGKQGTKDKGDFYMPGNDLYIVEAKNEVKFQPSTWIAEAEVEAKNAGVPFGVVFFKRPRRGKPEEQFVLCTVDTFLSLVHPEYRDRGEA